jgi:predicted phosphodiesterase
MEERIVMLSDIHGHGEYTDALQDIYKKEKVDKYVIAGDLIYGGSAPAKVMEFIKNHNTETLLGNHEAYFLSGINGRDKESRDLILNTYDDFSVRSLRKILNSYRIDEYKYSKKADILMAVKDKMQQAGHLQIIENANLYYEDDQSIAVHAGLTQDDWDNQKTQLDKDLDSIRQGYVSEPPQVFDDSFNSLSSSESLSGVTDKDVITGHNHRISPEKRITDDGKRIHIATRLNNGEPLLAWQSWNRKLVEVRL